MTKNRIEHDTEVHGAMGLTAPWMNVASSKWADNWSWAERSDKLGEHTLSALETASRQMLEGSEKAFTGHIDFVSQRLKADLACFRSLVACKEPAETAKTLQGFFRDMWHDYEAQAQKTLELLQTGLTETSKAGDLIVDTAAEVVEDMAQQTMEAASKAMEPANSNGTGEAVPRKPAPRSKPAANA